MPIPRPYRIVCTCHWTPHTRLVHDTWYATLPDALEAMRARQHEPWDSVALLPWHDTDAQPIRAMTTRHSLRRED